VMAHEVLRLGSLISFGLPGRILKTDIMSAKVIKVVEMPQKAFLNTSVSFKIKSIAKGRTAVK